MFKLRMTVWFIFMALITVMTWWASDPRSLWILWVTIPALLMGLAIEIRKKRKAA